MADLTENTATQQKAPVDNQLSFLQHCKRGLDEIGMTWWSALLRNFPWLIITEISILIQSYRLGWDPFYAAFNSFGAALIVSAATIGRCLAGKFEPRQLKAQHGSKVFNMAEVVKRVAALSAIFNTSIMFIYRAYSPVAMFCWNSALFVLYFALRIQFPPLRDRPLRERLVYIAVCALKFSDASSDVAVAIVMLQNPSIPRYLCALVIILAIIDFPLIMREVDGAEVPWYLAVLNMSFEAGIAAITVITGLLYSDDHDSSSSSSSTTANNESNRSDEDLAMMITSVIFSVASLLAAIIQFVIARAREHDHRRHHTARVNLVAVLPHPG